MNWQPIETAPKDGTPILAFWQPPKGWPCNGGNYAVTEWSGGQWRPAGDDEDEEWSEPDFWMPLPEPPK